MTYRAVFFDIGGVVVGSPLHAIAAYERELGLPPGAINRVVVATAPGGAWSRLERGELRLPEFYPAFEADCAEAGWTISARELMARVEAALEPRPAMLTAIQRLRVSGLRVAAITNNWIAEDEGTGRLRPHFDAFLESAVTGLRKPDPRIFELACRTLDVKPAESIFLDDIGLNLKSARQLGMTTVRVDDPATAIRELEELTGLSLQDASLASTG